ncbi:MAG: GTP-binding protein [Pontibacterium sp.]
MATRNHKLLFVGPVGSGKTTAIRNISDIDCLDTEAQVSDVTGRRKQTTTVAMDYGRLALVDDERIHLYGTPGQSRFRFMWELLADEIARDCVAVVMMIDNTRNYPLRDLKYYAREFSNIILGRRLIVAVTRGDIRAEPGVETYEALLKELQLDAHVCFVDGRKRSDLLNVVELALGGISEFDDWNQLRARAKVAEASTTLEPAAELPVEDYKGEKVEIKPEVLDAIRALDGVTGVAATDENGDLIATHLDNDRLENLIAVSASVAEEIGHSGALGGVSHFVYRDRNLDNLLIFVWEGRALGVTSVRRASIHVVRQQVNDLMQWG